MSIQLKEGGTYLDREGVKHGPLRVTSFEHEWPFTDDSVGRGAPCWTPNGLSGIFPFSKLPIDLVEEVCVPEAPVFRTDGARADLAVAYPLSDQIIGFTLTVAGKPQQFTMTRSAAASFIGRMAEALAK